MKHYTTTTPPANGHATSTAHSAATQKGTSIKAVTRRIINVLDASDAARKELRRLDNTYDRWRHDARPQSPYADSTRERQQKLKAAEAEGIRMTTDEDYTRFVQTVVPPEYIGQLLQYMPSFQQLPAERQSELASEAHHLATGWLARVQLEIALQLIELPRRREYLTGYAVIELLAGRGFTVELTAKGVNVLYGGSRVELSRGLHHRLRKILGYQVGCYGPWPVGSADYQLLVVKLQWYHLVQRNAPALQCAFGEALLGFTPDELRQLVDDTFATYPAGKFTDEVRCAHLRTLLAVRTAAAGEPPAALPVPSTALSRLLPSL